MYETTFLYGLHRPFHKPLKAVVWVCEFIFYCRKHEKNISLSEFPYHFFIYFISKLNKQYRKLKKEDDIKEGVPLFYKTSIILDKLEKLSYEDRVFLIKKCLIQRESEEDKIIYSTYKATSYYLSLAKKKLGFIDEKNSLTKIGNELIVYKSSFFNLASSQKKILFEQIIKNDFIIFLSLCLSFKLKKKFKLHIEDIHLSFIDNVYNINYFKYVQKSQALNYDNVRLSWIQLLDILDNRNNIRKKYLDIIRLDENIWDDFKILQENFIKYVQENLLKQNKLQEQYRLLEEKYRKAIDEGKHDLGYVNLYDIKKDFRMSSTNFGKFLNEYYFSMKKNRIILFSNVVSSIDKRQRFLIKTTPVIKIRIIKKDGTK